MPVSQHFLSLVFGEQGCPRSKLKSVTCTWAWTSLS